MNKYKSIVEDIEKNAIDYGKNNHEITLLTQKYFQVSDLYKMLIEKKKAKKHTILINMCLLKDYNANKKSIQKELFVFLQAIEDSSGLKILVQYELEEAQRNQNKKKSTYKETSDIYSEW